MKMRFWVALLLIGFAGCKKEKSQQNIISFDFEGAHYSMPLTQAYLTVIDIGANPGKYLYLHTDSSTYPILSFLVRENTTDHNLANFATLTYPSMLTVSQCTDTISTTNCIGFSMAYADKVNGSSGTYSKTDKFSFFNVVQASGTPTILTASFACQLVDSNNTIGPKQITNGLIWDATYAKH